MLCFFVTPVWTVADRFVGGVGVSSNRAGLMEFAFGRAASKTWDVPVRSAATRNISAQHLFHVGMSILGTKKKILQYQPKKREKKKRKYRIDLLDKPELCGAKKKWDLCALAVSHVAHRTKSGGDEATVFLSLEVRRAEV